MTSSFLSAVGARYRDFVVTKVQPIAELQCVLRELTHEPTGALVMQIENADPENLFCLSFRTLPSSSNGAAHILEHTVLCGSERFPVKDPFFSMNRRSLNTFMNALTGSDFTCYPAASQVEKDFYNLLDVYLDAVFHPELKELSFLQEGHRLEFTDPEDPTTALEIKGIVFNEMKGSLTSADARLWHAMMQRLCPDLPYAHNSGGEPSEIPNLTYQELIEFHRTYYHPSRCLFFFYGNLPLQKHLDFIEEKELKKSKRLPSLPPLPHQPRFSAPHRDLIHYPAAEGEEISTQTLVCFGWLTTPLINQEEMLALSVLDAILMESDASLLKRSLLQSGLCIQADAYMDNDMSEVPYLIVCKGCDPEKIDLLEEKLKLSLREIIENGIPFHLIEAAIHQLEFSRTEIIGDHSPFGLTLFMRSALAKQHDCPPENALMIHSLFNALLEKIKDPHYLTGLLEKHLLNNSHFVRLTMLPDSNLAAKEASEEKAKLQTIQGMLTDEEKEKIVKQAKELAAYQEKTENQSIDCLPKVGLEDISPAPKTFALRQEQVGNLHLFHHDCFTNEILYADLVFDLPEISLEDLPYLQLLTSLLPEIGAANRDYTANLEYIQAHLGAVGASCSLFVQANAPQKSKPCLMIRAKALSRKADKLCTFFQDVATSAHFHEKKRIEELVIQLHNALEHRLNRSAMKYAMQIAPSGFSTPCFIHEQWHGLSYFKTVRDWTRDLPKFLPRLIEKLCELQEKLFCLKNPHLILSCDEKIYSHLKKEQFYGLASLPQKAFTPWDCNYPLPDVASQAREIPSPVAFTCKAFPTISYQHPDAAAINLSTFLFENKILHRAIREQGGAYGAGAQYHPILGYFSFHSYRDPHIADTLKSFESAIETIAIGKFDQGDLEEAKLEIIQQFDSPVAPGSRAFTAYGQWRTNKTLEQRQAYRNKILSLTPKEVAKAVDTHLLPHKDKGVVVTFSGASLLEKEAKGFPILPI